MLESMVRVVARGHVDVHALCYCLKPCWCPRGWLEPYLSVSVTLQHPGTVLIPMAQGSTEVHENVPSVLLSEAMLMCIGCAPEAMRMFLLPWRAMLVFMVWLQLWGYWGRWRGVGGVRCVWMSLAGVTTESHVDVYDPCCQLKPWWCPWLVL